MTIVHMSAFPALYQFMSCYWMETADLVYGDAAGATHAFARIEMPSMRELLIQDLMLVEQLGMIVGRPDLGSREASFWAQGGARWIGPEEAQQVRSILSGVGNA